MIKQLPAICLLSVFFSTQLQADGNSNLAYVTDNHNVFVINPTEGIATGTVSSTGFASPEVPLQIAISSDGSFAYLTDYVGNIYKIDTTTNAVTNYINKGSFSIPNPYMIGISPDMSFGLVGDGTATSVFKIDIATSQVTSQISGLNYSPYSVAITPDNHYAYVTDYSSNLYRIDMATNTIDQTISGFSHSGIVALSNDGTFAYITDDTGSVYKMNLATSILEAVSGGTFNDPLGVVINPDNKTAYVSNATEVSFIDTLTNTVTNTVTLGGGEYLNITPDGKFLIVTNSGDTIFQIDLSTNTSTTITNHTAIPFDGTYWVATAPFTKPKTSEISLLRLAGSNKTIASYFNKNATSAVKNLFSSLQGTSLTNALERTNPVRNSFATFATQINQISLSRLVNTHLVGLRNTNQNFANKTSQMGKITKGNSVNEFNGSNIDDLELIAKNTIKENTETLTKKKQISKPLSSNFWMAGFGEYFYDNPKHQSPSFNNVSGGFVTAFDYKIKELYPIGAGFAYAHSGLTQDNNFGQATVNQESLFAYGSFAVHSWYFDTAIWGGYYQIKNERNISFPGFLGKAHSHTHGWQLTPHLESGYNYWTGGLNINPFTMLDSVNNWESAFKEHGATDLNMGQKGRYCSFLRSETGIRFQEVITYTWGRLIFLEKASYAYQKTFGTGSVTAFLVGSLNSFSVTTLTTAQNLGIAEVEARFNPFNAKYPYGSLSGHVEAGSSYQSYQAMAELGWKF